MSKKPDEIAAFVAERNAVLIEALQKKQLELGDVIKASKKTP